MLIKLLELIFELEHVDELVVPSAFEFTRDEAIVWRLLAESFASFRASS